MNEAYYILWLFIALNLYMVWKYRKAIWWRMNMMGEMYADYIKTMIEVNKNKNNTDPKTKDKKV